MDALARLSHLFPPQEESSVLTLTCGPQDYSASLIARAVEDCDAHLLNLNVTAGSAEPGRLSVELRVSHRDAAGVARSLGRYGFEVERMEDESSADREKARRRVNELLRYLEV